MTEEKEEQKDEETQNIANEGQTDENQDACPEADDIRNMKAALDEQVDRYKRLQADFDNFRRRTRLEKEELSGIVTQNMLLNFLPVLDNFERALTGGANQDTTAFLSGVEMIYRQFTQVMEKSGLMPLEAVGQIFDPQKHEAVMRVEDEEKPEGTIVEEFQKGYIVAGKVIRPSMVKVVGA